MTKNLGPRIDDSSYAFLDRTFDNTHQGARFVLEAFPTLYQHGLREIRGRFSAGELKLLIDSYNGTGLTAQIAGQVLVGHVEDAMSLDALDSKWGVQAGDFLARLRSLTSFHAATLELWATAFWHTDYDAPGSMERYIASLL